MQDKLYRFALRLTGNAQEAADVVQDVMEKAWKMSIDGEAAIQNWEAWCMTLTRNRSMDQFRSTRLRRTDDLEKAVHYSIPAADVAQQTENGDLVNFVRQRMADLPEKQRLVLHLRDVEGLTYEDIAITLQISVDQVKVNLHRARKQVRAYLETL